MRLVHGRILSIGGIRVTRWRVDHEIKSDFVLVKEQKQIVFHAPDTSHSIYLVTRRGPGKHAADELHLSSHVILDDDDPLKGAERAEVYLEQFLETLAVVTSGSYRVKGRTLIVDWTPGLKERKCFHFKNFPNPHVPQYALSQNLVDTVAKYSAHSIPLDVRLAMSWWARGVAASAPHDQFQYFWYALEILAEHLKPSTKVASTCPHCHGDLHCMSCDKVPLHRPYPKQAIRMVIEKHVKPDPLLVFEKLDDARNKLLHGVDRKGIEQDLGVPWEKLSDKLGKITWLALLDTLAGQMMSVSAEAGREKLALIDVSTYTHYQVNMRTDLIMGAHHANPADPQIDEFMLKGFEITMTVNEREKEPSAKPGEAGASPVPKHADTP